MALPSSRGGPPMPPSGSGAYRPEFDGILSASMRNDVNKIRRMVLEEGVPPTHTNAVGQSALHIASLWGNVESVRLLLELGADPRARNSMSGGTPLHMVAQSQKGTVPRRLEVIDMLLRAGASNSRPDNYGSLPVEAVIDGNYKNIDEQNMLIEKLQPRKPDIVEAIEERNVEKVYATLHANPSDGLFQFRNKTPIMIVFDDLEKIMEDITREDDNIDRNHLVTIDCYNNIIKTIVKFSGPASTVPPPTEDTTTGEDDDGTNKEPPPSFLFRVATFQYDVCGQLRQLEQRLEENDGDNNDHLKNNPNFMESIQILQKLLYLYEDMMLTLHTIGHAPITKDTMNMLHNAARRNFLPVAKFFIEKLQINPNIPGRQDMTPLHFAARSGQINIVKYLLEQPNIDITAKDNRGKTALDSARINNKEEVIKMIEDKMDSMNTTTTTTTMMST